MEKTRRVSQACEACKLRKVKCNGQVRCQQCSHLDLRCIYSAYKAQRRTSQKRGRLISEYKRSTAEGGAFLAQHKLPAINIPPFSPLPSVQPNGPAGPGSASCFAVAYDQDFFLDLLSEYESVVYPVNPIIPADEVRESVMKMQMDLEHRSFAYAYAAVTTNLAKTGPSSSPNITSQIVSLSNMAIQLRGGAMPDRPVTIRRIMVSMFLHNCLMTLQNFDMAFYYIREAITLIQILRVDNKEVMSKLDQAERARRQRLYWEAFVHERFMAIVDFKPPILTPLDDLPERDRSIPEGIQEGFDQIIKLFRLVDGQFLQNWLGSHHDVSLTAAWIEKKQRELDEDDLSVSSPPSARLTDTQQADLIITRQWLRSLVWQMAMSRCLLSSGASKECMSLLFPVRLSQQLRFLITSMGRTAIEIHGSGILKKLFELADTIADVVIHVPPSNVDETTARVDDFLFLIHFLFTFPRFDQFEKKILQGKLQTLRELFPHLQHIDAGIPAAAIQHVDLHHPWLDITRSMLSQRSGPASAYPALITAAVTTANHHTAAKNATGEHSTRPDDSMQDPTMPFQVARWQSLTRRLSMAFNDYPQHALDQI